MDGYLWLQLFRDLVEQIDGLAEHLGGADDGEYVAGASRAELFASLNALALLPLRTPAYAFYR